MAKFFKVITLKKPIFVNYFYFELYNFLFIDNNIGKLIVDLFVKKNISFD